MITIITWLWHQDNYKADFRPEHVEILRNMVARHFAMNHEFVCLTNCSQCLHSLERRGINTVRMPDSYLDEIPNPNRPDTGPSCYRRLWQFSDEFPIQGRIVSLDLDVVIVDNVIPLWNRPENIVLWGDPVFRGKYNGSMVMHTATLFPHLYRSFDGTKPVVTKQAGYFGSDQAWLSFQLGEGRPIWTRDDGVYSFRTLDDPAKRTHPDKPKTTELPDNARIVFFHGRSNPWDEDVQEKYPWVREHYR